MGDVIAIHDEVIDPAKPYTLFDPIHTWKKRTVTHYTIRSLQAQLFRAGQCIYDSPDIHTIQRYCASQVETLWEQIKRFENPQTYFVDLSQRLWNCKQELLETCRGNEA